MGPSRPGNPVIIGPRWTKRPSESVRTVPVTVRGAPCRSSTLPPIARVTRAPTPAFAHNCTAAASQMHATAAPRAPTRTSSRRISVPSPAAPPPVLSAMSASRMGRPSAASAFATASFTGSAACTNSCRCSQATRFSSVASRSASGPVVVGDHVDAEARVGDVRQGKPAKIETEMTFGSSSISSARS